MDLESGPATNSLSSGKEGNDEEIQLYWSTHGLPKQADADGRFAWEPPELDYSEYIGEEYEKKREVMLKFLKNDKARTTELMDVDIEQYLLNSYGGWAWGRRDRAPDSESKKFFDGLYNELSIDLDEVDRQWANNGCYTLKEIGDGNYEVVQYRGDNRVHYFNKTIEDPPYRTSIIRINQELQVAENTQISSEEEKLSGTEPPAMNIPPMPPTPLAVHLVSLRSHTSLNDTTCRSSGFGYEEVD